MSAGRPPLRLRLGDERFEPRRLCYADAPAETGDPVVAPALIVDIRRGPSIGLLDQVAIQHPLQRSIQVARLQVHAGRGPLGNVLRNGIAMALAVRQGKEDLIGNRAQRQQFVGITTQVSMIILETIIYV